MAHPDLDKLFDALLAMAQMLLKKQGEFYPIGGVISSDGILRHVGGKIEGDDHPHSQSLIDLLTETFRKEAAAGRVRAAAICYEVLTIPPGKDRKQDAICCSAEHCLGEAVDVFVPYALRVDGNFSYDEAFAAKRIPQFFEKPKIN
jgi:hypothetical protein